MPVYRNNVPKTGGTVTPVTNSPTTLQVTQQNGTTSVLNVDTTNGRVAIGNAAPGCTLHADSNTIGGTGEIRVDSPAGNQAQFTFYKSNVFRWQNYVPSNSTDWRLFGGSADRLIVQSGGNTGISVTPTSMLHVGGPISTAITTTAKTGAYTITATDSTVTGDTTTAAFTITLPTATSIAGRQYTIKRISASANNLTVGTTSSQTIDGATTKTLGAQYSALTVQSDGANWQIVMSMGTVT